MFVKLYIFIAFKNQSRLADFPDAPTLLSRMSRGLLTFQTPQHGFEEWVKACWLSDTPIVKNLAFQMDDTPNFTYLINKEIYQAKNIYVECSFLIPIWIYSNFFTFRVIYTHKYT